MAGKNEKSGVNEMKTLYGVGFFDLLDREAQKLIEYDKMSGGTGSWAGRLLETQIKFYNLGMRGKNPLNGRSMK